MVVQVGPYQRIVGFSWPQVDQAPKYIELPLYFEENSTFGQEYGSTPTALWDDSFAIAYEYLIQQELFFTAAGVYDYDYSYVTPAGVPGLQSQSFGAWQYVDQRTFVGTWWANNTFIIQPLTGAEITDGPTISGQYARRTTSLSVDLRLTPFTGGTPTRYTNIGFENRLAVTFNGSKSFDTIENTELGGTMVFDFSGVSLSVYGKTYNAYGLNAVSAKTYGIDADSSFKRLILKRSDIP